ncbi:MAG: peptide-methionine (S)-S-oxide reductase MsrA [Pseudomonadota bacterium]|mgnify:FL=1
MSKMQLKTRVPLVIVAAIAVFTLAAPGSAERPVIIPAPALDPAQAEMQAVAILAGGCFWGLEAVFENAKGVKSVTSGYAGGKAEEATYDAVITEATNHAEAVRIVYDPRVISYGSLLQIFFSAAHNPTELNRQGPDVGRSYRSAIFPQTLAQTTIARAYIAQLTAAKAYDGAIVTRIESGKFYAAEAYHQDFFTRNPMHPYIVRWDKPKLAGARKTFPNLFR